MIKILLIEDDMKISKYLKMELTFNNYKVDVANTGTKGIEYFNKNSYNIVLLDLMLPEKNGEEICKTIRKSSEIPIIILTAKNHISNKVGLLDSGADDYITKPFIIDELLARIRVILRNKKNYLNSNTLSYKDIKLDITNINTYINNNPISLTKTEFNLLHYFILNHEIVLSREQILNNVWGYDYLGGDKIVDVFVNTLRKKLKTNGIKYIQTVRGFGYILKF